MVQLVQGFYRQALAPSTLRSYHSAQSRYIMFCSSYNISPVPVSESSLSMFVAALAGEGVSHSSIKSYLSAIRYMQLAHVGNDPQFSNMVSLSYVLLGINKRSQAIAGTANPRHRLPITSAIMRSLKRAWELRGVNFDTAMLWAACCTCFFGFLRSGEATVPSQAAVDPSVHLAVSDVSLSSQSNPSAVIINIKASKTDPFRQGVSIYLGRTDKDLCPVGAILCYIALRGLSPGPLFLFQNGQFLTRAALVREIRQALQSVGIEASAYSGHSFRIGAATSAAAAGVEDALIKILGRWKSSAYMQYVRIPRESLSSISSVLADQQ